MNHTIRQVNVDYLEAALYKTLKLLNVMAESPTLVGAAASIVRDDLLLIRDANGSYVVGAPANEGSFSEEKLAKAMADRQRLPWEAWFAIVARTSQAEGLVVPASLFFRWKERHAQGMSPREAIKACRQIMKEHGFFSHTCMSAPGSDICVECGKPPARGETL